MPNGRRESRTKGEFSLYNFWMDLYFLTIFVSFERAKNLLQNKKGNLIFGKVDKKDVVWKPRKSRVLEGFSTITF